MSLVCGVILVIGWFVVEGTDRNNAIEVAAICAAFVSMPVGFISAIMGLSRSRGRCLASWVGLICSVGYFVYLGYWAFHRQWIVT